MNIMYKFIALGVSILLSRFLLTKLCGFLKITSLVSTLLCGGFIFVGLNMILNYQVDIFFGRSRSMIDSLVGMIFGVGQFLLICIAANFCILIMNQKSINIPRWMQDAVSTESDPPKVDPMQDTFTYGILRAITNQNVPEKIQKILSSIGPKIKNYVKGDIDQMSSSQAKSSPEDE